MVPTWSKNGPDMTAQKRVLARHMLYTMLNQSSKFQSSKWSGSHARPYMVLTLYLQDSKLTPITGGGGNLPSLSFSL